MATLYLLHFDKPLPQPHNKRGVCARHYLGIAVAVDVYCLTRYQKHWALVPNAEKSEV